MSANPNFDRLASQTLQNYSKKLADNVSNHIPFLALMKKKGSIKLDGGTSIVLPVLDKFGNAQAISGGEVFDISVQDGPSAAEYNWKETVSPATYLKVEAAKNSGTSKEIDLIDTTIMQAELTLENKVSEMIFGDGTGTSGKEMLGLEAIIAVDPTNDSLGGIPSATNSFWRNATNASVGSFASNGLTEMSTIMRTVQRGTDKTDLIVTDTTNFGRLESVANGRAEFTNAKLAELGFEALRFHGVDVIYDDNITADRMYGVNTRWTHFFIHENVNFVTGKFIEPANQNIMSAKIELLAQMGTSRREANWVLSGFSA